MYWFKLNLGLSQIILLSLTIMQALEDMIKIQIEFDLKSYILKSQN